MKKQSTADAAKKSVKTIFKKMWEKTPKAIRCTKGSAVIVAMAASVIAAPVVDELGKQAVKDMAEDMSQHLNYTWDPFDGDFA